MTIKFWAGTIQPDMTMHYRQFSIAWQAKAAEAKKKKMSLIVFEVPVEDQALIIDQWEKWLQDTYPPKILAARR